MVEPLPFLRLCFVRSRYEKNKSKFWCILDVFVFIRRKANKYNIIMYQSRFVYCFNINQDNVSNAFRLRIFFRSNLKELCDEIDVETNFEES